MIWPLPDPWAVAVSAVVWLGVSLAIGKLAVTWAPARLEQEGPVTRIRAWERDGRTWQRWVRVLRWKDALPEAGEFFGGGTSKRHLGSPNTEGLEAFRRETMRAERVHWSIMATGPVQVLWCRPTVALGMVVFGVVFNAPFIVVQRYNRGRLDRLLLRRRGAFVH